MEPLLLQTKLSYIQTCDRTNNNTCKKGLETILIQMRTYTKSANYVAIHRHLSHQEKSAYLKRFMLESVNHIVDIRVLLATNGVANAGILVDSNETPTAYSQNQGRFPHLFKIFAKSKLRQSRMCPQCITSFILCIPNVL